MSLHFNWSRLEEMCAEAVRHLINKRLAEVVERINSRNTAQPRDDAAESALATSKMSETISTTAPGASGATVSSYAGPHVGGGANAAGAGRSECSRNAGNGRSQQEKATGLTVTPASAGIGVTANRSELISNPSATSAVSSVAALHPCSIPGSYASAGLPAAAGAASSLAAAMVPSGSASGSAGGSGGSGGVPGVSLSGPAINTAASPHNGGHHGAGAALLVSGTNNDNNDVGPSESTSLAGEPIAVPAMTAYRSNAGTSCAAAGGAAPAGGESARRVPPIVYLEVGRLEWGTTPPFVEIVAFENAIDGPPGRTCQHLQQQQQSRGLFGGGRDGQGTKPETRGPSPYTPIHPASMDTLMTASTVAVEPGAGLVAAADNMSEGSPGFVSHVHTGANTPHLVTGPHPLFDAASATGGGVGGGACTSPHQPPASSSTSQFPSQPEPVDSLESVLGPGGLYVRFHVTYGGSMHLSLNIEVQHEIRLGAVALRVSLPMMFYLANLDLDCYVCVNMKHSICEVWLEPGPLSSSVINRLTITATVGGDNDGGGSDLEGGRKNGGAGGYGASSADFFSHFGSSISDDDGGEDGSGVYVNEHEVSQFVLHELRAILRETLVAPHSVSIPMSFGGGGIGE
ncbi:hypothetical protein GH5_04051 [Leishmania sp. Ghana 2012 LV757]|uniref:hypothetical protein n=1 Tax=Leishmania sp. Ghana 2012 LV757 TaxID=2803181 RepID=UPI001B7AB919|nr:hypothetical protein GH5_04051 [Leishmania sp. Ghana 2012 LV757]